MLSQTAITGNEVACDEVDELASVVSLVSSCVQNDKNKY